MQLIREPTLTVENDKIVVESVVKNICNPYIDGNPKVEGEITFQIL